jgi:hypothetical protein
VRNGEDLAVRVGDGMGGGGSAVEELDLAEELAGAEDGERLFPTPVTTLLMRTRPWLITWSWPPAVPSVRMTVSCG